MSAILVQAPGIFTTVQDLGREGFGPMGVSASGAADPMSMRIGNRLAGNPEGAAALEMTLVGGAFTFERADVLREGSDVSIVATGVMVSRALAAAERLAERDLEARVINVSTLKPLDEATIIAAARETAAIVTVEEATVEGGLGAAVAATVVRHAPVQMRMLGVTGFAPTGTAEFLFDHFGLNAEGIVRAALQLKAR